MLGMETALTVYSPVRVYGSSGGPDQGFKTLLGLVEHVVEQVNDNAKKQFPTDFILHPINLENAQAIADFSRAYLSEQYEVTDADLKSRAEKAVAGFRKILKTYDVAKHLSGGRPELEQEITEAIQSFLEEMAPGYMQAAALCKLIEGLFAKAHYQLLTSRNCGQSNQRGLEKRLGKLENDYRCITWIRQKLPLHIPGSVSSQQRVLHLSIELGNLIQTEMDNVGDQIEEVKRISRAKTKAKFLAVAVGAIAVAILAGEAGNFLSTTYPGASLFGETCREISAGWFESAETVCTPSVMQQLARDALNLIY